MQKLIYGLLLTSLIVQAEWVKYGKDTNGCDQYVDNGTIKQTQQFRRAWSITNCPNGFGGYGGLNLGHKIMSMKSLKEFDCEGDKSRTLSSLAYSGPMGDGNMVGSSNKTGDWDYASPNSVVKALMDNVCSKDD